MSRLIAIFFIFFTLNYAQDLNTLIKKLHNAPENKRYEIMNKIKIKLIELNSVQRLEVINKLKRKYQHKNKLEHKQKMKNIHNRCYFL